MIKPIFPQKTGSIWTRLGVALVVLILAGVAIKFVPSFFTAQNQLAYLSFVSGDVKVSDGITDTAAKEGALISRNIRTLLKTGHGIASLTLPDGSFVIIDSSTIIEFNRQKEGSNGQSFAFNLLKGRLLVINIKNSQKPTLLIIGDNIAVRVFQATMGLEADPDSEMIARVDCLVGQCLVNGVHLVNSGQNARIGLDRTVQVNDGIQYDAWISLERASKANPTLANLFVSMFSTINQTIIPTAIQTEIRQATSIRTITPTSSPSPTFTLLPSMKQTPTSTETPLLTATLSPTPVLPTPTATLIIIVRPTIPQPNPTSIPPTSTPLPPSATPLPPTSTPEPPTPIPPQPTPVPITPTPVPIPLPTIPLPTSTESSEPGLSQVPVHITILAV